MLCFSETVNIPFEKAIALITEALKTEGFGVLTEIDVKQAFKKKLDADFRPYLILGACHPQIAYQMLQIDHRAGTLYPCNVVVEQHENGTVEVSAINPEAMFIHIQDEKAQEIARHAATLMSSVMDKFRIACAENQELALTN